MRDWLKFFGMWLADGYCRNTNNSLGKPRYVVGIKQKESNGNMIREILDKLPFSYKESIDNYGKVSTCINFEIYDKQLWTYLHQFGKSNEKYIPREIKDLDCSSLSTLLKYYFYGDGSKTIRSTQIDTFLSRTVSKQLAEDVQEILLKLGHLSHITMYPYTLPSGESRTVYQQRTSKDPIHNKYWYPSCKKSKEHYKGKVWCPNLEKNGVFLARRNGKEFITGNCSSEFVLHSLDLLEEGQQAIFFLKIQFLESQKRYKEIFSKYPPKYIYVFSERCLCAMNGEFEIDGKRQSSAVCYAWYVFEKGFKGDTILRWC